MSLRFIDWVWQVKGSLSLAPGQSSDDVFDKLDPLFQQKGTSHERTNDALVFHKKDQAAQDEMSVFDSGILKIDKGGAVPVLRYRLTSRILLFCFLAPLLFFGIGQLTIAMGKFDKLPTAADIAEKKEAAAKMGKMPLNPLDQALGAPAPEKPGKDRADKLGGDDKKPSPTPAYVFAAIFAVLYIVGRVLEGHIVKTLFKRRLNTG